MAESKYEHLVTYNKEHPPNEWIDRVPRDPESGRILIWADNDAPAGAFYYEAFMAMKPTFQGSWNDPPHFHPDWDEVLGFFGTDPANPDDLGGEVEFGMEDEMRSITKSCAIYVPRGMMHGPLVVKRVHNPARPMIFVTTGNGKYYTQTLPPGWEDQLRESGAEPLP